MTTNHKRQRDKGLKPVLFWPTIESQKAIKLITKRHDGNKTAALNAAVLNYIKDQK